MCGLLFGLCRGLVVLVVGCGEGVGSRCVSRGLAGGGGVGGWGGGGPPETMYTLWCIKYALYPVANI